ncbi:amino acid adenylation domain-containing protein [Pedobacter sp. SAFR-022]|uniref:amino acid adenylation domain-containing protein n=1 Tax=Pedobacter sp. SAFR-022 TaxID=3436861 RepID=UPI003F823988
MTKYIPVDFDPFGETKEIERITPTNDSQKEIWLACMFGGEEANLAYNESISLDFEGNLQVDDFKRAVRGLILRHEALRSTFSADGEWIFTYKDFPVDFVLEDLSPLGASARRALNESINKELAIALNLQEGPLFKVYLHKLAANLHVFTIIKHHAVCDGWSSGIILEDISKMYNAYTKGLSVAMGKAWQMSDYVKNERLFKTSADYQTTESYWLDLYKGKIPVVDLPTDYPRVSPRGYKGMRLDFELGKGLLDQLKVLAGKSGASLVTTLLTAFEVFLHSKTRQHELVVGLPASGQAASGLNDVVGHCVNLLPIKTVIDPTRSFKQHLKIRKSAILDAYEHQRLTFGELIKKLYIPRDGARITLVPVIFNIDMGMDQAVSFDGLKHSLISNPRAYETFDIFLNATGSKNKLVLEWSFNTGLFKPETIEIFHRDFTAILEKIVLNSDVIISSLAQHEEHELAISVEQSGLKFSSINDLLEQVYRSYPAKTAVSFNGQHLSYNALNTKVNQLANKLIVQGVMPGDFVAVFIDRSADMLVSLLAILKASAVYIPLDPSYPKDRIEFMLEDSGANFLLISRKYQGYYQDRTTEIIAEIEDQTDLSVPLPDFTPVSGSDLAYVLYTSGSTGKPKGVKISHGNLSNFLLSMLDQPGINKDDKLLAITTISFDIAGLELFLPLIAGAEVIIADAASAKDGRILADMITESGITMMQATPSTWQMLIDSGWSGSSSLKILAGGEALTDQMAKHLLPRSSELWNMYGPTETTIWSTLKQIRQDDRTITVGHPIRNTRIFILDEHGREVPKGIVGEVCIAGDGVSQGYLHRPELTQEKFIIEPGRSVSGKRMYRTGDLGTILPNGELQCLGRMDQQVKIRGHRIELGEIESILSTAPGIKQTVVAVSENDKKEKSLVAYVTLEQEMEQEQALSWKDRWETLYNIGAETNKNEALPDQNLDGTLLEYYENGKELAAQSEEWLRSSVERIKALHPRSVYEIGSGAGQILYELTDDVDYYLATDYAQTAIDKLNETLCSNPEKWGHVEAKVASADDFSAVGNRKFDLVLLHSVAQYFPGADYLIDVVKKALGAIDGTGCIFIGDMQGQNSLEMCHAMDHLPKAPEKNTLAFFKEIIENRVRIEDELVADPAFFYGLRTTFPEIKAVDIQLRKGKSINEITKYHYDVWIYVGAEKPYVTPAISRTWHSDTKLSDVEQVLRDNPSSVVELKGIYNSRTAKDCHLLKLMHTANEETLLADIKTAVNAVTEGMHPDLFWATAERLGIKAHVRWSSDGTDGLFDVVFIPSAFGAVLPDAPYGSGRTIDMASHIRTPFSKERITISKAQILEWKRYAGELLPPFMVPEQFVGLKKFPLTPNGKIDRKMLPKVESKRMEAESTGELPSTENELLVAAIWAEALGLENLKVTDDFFELGGHSLLAMKVMVAIEKRTGKRLPLATLFDNSTLGKMALQLEEDKPKMAWSALVPIRTSGSKKPLFLVHGGGMNILVFKSLSSYFDKDQPIYGIQALGLNYEMDVPDSIEKIVEKYLEEMLTVQADGPFMLVGYSLGGILVYEMARQLSAMGKEVSMVGVIDTYASTGEDLTDTKQLLKKVTRQFNKVPFFTKSFLNYPAETLSYQKTILKRKLKGALKAETTDRQFELSDYEAEIYERYSTALSKYKLAADDIEVTLFRAKKRLYYLDDNQYLGWKLYAKKGVKIWEVPGDHKTFLYPPHDEELVRVLQSAINSINHSGENSRKQVIA